MAGLFSAISLTADIVKAISSSDDTNKAILDLIKNQGKARIVRSDGSMTRFLSSFIVEPVIVVSKEAYKADPIENLIGLNTDLFSSFYLQAFNVLGNIHGVDIATAIAVMSSDTSSFKSAAIIKGAEAILSNEAKDYFRDLESTSRYLTFSHEDAKSDMDVLNELRQRLSSMPGVTEDDVKEIMENTLTTLVVCDDKQLNSIIEEAKKIAPNDASFLGDLSSCIRQKRNSLISNGDLPPDTNLPDDAFNSVKYSILTFFTAKNVGNGKFPPPGGKGPNDPKQAMAKAAASVPVDKNNKGYIKWKMTQQQQITAAFKNSKIGDKVAENLYAVHTRELNITLNITNSQIGTQVGGDNDGKKIKGDFSVSKTIVIPITIKANIIVTDISNIINMLKPNDRTKKFGYRLDEWKSGSISLRELIFCGDLIKAYKGNKLSDKDGLLSIIKRREESANSKLISAGVIGFEKFYNMLIVSADEKILLNKHVGGNIDNERYKDELLTEAHALTLTIVDPDYERCNIVTKDIRGKSEISFKALKKKKDNDLNDIYKALVANRSPVF